ncbi:30S ribosomal protein S8e [Methanoregula sp.]|uniref:30S ribosomal protein S8e n=1 Tax=Methanoregula sp. TaxID=2052170 RepID=UPI00236A6E25|nr:30S ribosomal protein S8e [Methanoregula sp.]MDD1686960.1 30S ribosomal protein S8e [Methanoregula sp.]
MQWQKESVRKVTGGRRRPAAMKRRADIGGAPAETHLGENRTRVARTYGGNHIVIALRANLANVTNPKNGETKRVKIETVEKNTANPNYVRRNLLNKGAVIKTELGSARITSRPGQDGVINALLLE